MPYDLEAVGRGYGECAVGFNGEEITLRYRADLDGRALHAMRRALTGTPTLIGPPGSRVPDTDAVMRELVRVLLPCSAEIEADQRGWDITRGGVPVPITLEELERLDFQLPIVLLGAIMADVRDPNRRRPSLNGSRATAASEPTASLTTTASSVTPDGQGRPSGLSLVSETTPDAGPAGLSGFGA